MGNFDWQLEEPPDEPSYDWHCEECMHYGQRGEDCGCPCCTEPPEPSR